MIELIELKMGGGAECLDLGQTLACQLRYTLALVKLS